MSRKNKPQYLLREKLRKDRKAQRKQEAKSWAVKYYNDAIQNGKTTEQIIISFLSDTGKLLPSTLGEIADRIGAPSVEALGELYSLLRSKL